MTDPYTRAQKKVKAKKGFYGHLAAYVTTNIVMFFVVLINEGSFGWLVPMSFWGIGLASHYLKVFGWPGSGAGSADWEEREIRKELEKEGYQLEDFEPAEEGLKLKEIKKVKEIKEERRPWKDDDFV